MKIGTCVLSVAVVWLFLSAGTDKAGITEGYHLGDLAPRIESLENNRGIDFRNRSESYTLVNFWAAYDGLESANQWYDGKGKSSLLYKTYGLKKGLRNFLIDGKGVIVGVDLTPEAVSRIVNKSV